MKRRAAACAMLLLLCGCAAKELTKEPTKEFPPIVVVRANFRSHLSVVRNCESRGVAPTAEAARAAGANLAVVFAEPRSGAPDRADSPRPIDNAVWVPFGPQPAHRGEVVGVRAFKCPDAFVDNVAARMKPPRDAPK